MKAFGLRFIVASAVSSVLAAGTGAAIAASPKLKGTYAESGETSCLVSMTVRGTPGGPIPIVPSGFDPATLTPNPGALAPSLFTLSFHAVRTFDGNGAGTYQGRTAAINFSPFAGSSTDIVATFTYVVAADGTITTEEATTGSVLSGTRAGQTTTNSFAMTGSASNNAQSLVLTTDSAGIETVTFSNGDVQQRICHRSRTLIRTSE